MRATLTRKILGCAIRHAAARASGHNGFVGNTRGATAVEFALVAAPFIALLCAILQSAMIFFAQRVLDEVTEEAGRYLVTGQAQQASITQAGFKTFLCTGANTSALVSALFTCSNIMINVQSYASFAAASTATPTLTFDSHGNVSNTWSYNTGNAGDIIVMQVMYQWPVILGPLSMNLSNLANGNRLLVSTIVFKSEPY